MTLSNQSDASHLCTEQSMFTYCCGTAEEKAILPTPWQHAISMLIVLISLILNSMMAITVCCNKRLHTVSNVFAVSLALSDICLAVIANTNFIFFGFHKVTVDIHVINMQHVFIFFGSFSLMCNHLNHLMISIERWLYIARPFLHQRVVTTKIIISSVIAVWILPIIFSSSLFGDICGLHAGWVRLHFCAVFASFHFILSIAQFSIYGHIAIITRRQTCSIKQIQVRESPRERKDLDTILTNLRNTWKQVRIFVVVFGSFFVFMTPWVCTNILAFSENNVAGIYNTTLYRTATSFALFQSYSNFLTHLMLDKDFKLVLKQCCGKIRCCICETKVDPF